MPRRKMRGMRRDKSSKHSHCKCPMNPPPWHRSARELCARVCVVMKKGVCVHVWWDREKGRGIAKLAVWMMFNWSSAQLNEAVNPLSPGCSYSEHHGTGLSRREGCRHITVAHTHTHTHALFLPPTRHKIQPIPSTAAHSEDWGYIHRAQSSIPH